MGKAASGMPAWELLGDQPESLAGLAAQVRRQLVVSAVTLDSGEEMVISRFGDRRWELGVYMHGPGSSESHKAVEWPDDCPAGMIDDAKAICYALKHRGRNGSVPPTWRTVRTVAILSVPFIRWLMQHGIERFDQVRPLHVANYVHLCKNVLKLEPSGVRNRLDFIDLLWRFRGDAVFPLSFDPWKNDSLSTAAGMRHAFQTAKTPIIPRPIQEQIYNYCLGVIDRSEPVLSAIEAGRMSAPWSLEAVQVRDAALYLVLITTGMRCDEVLGIETGAFRESTVDGVLHRWVRTIENKTGKGVVEYLCPAVTGRALQVLERYARPLQKILELEIQSLESQAPTPKAALRLAKARADVRRVFLTMVLKKNFQVAVVSTATARTGLMRTAVEAGVEWTLTPHQTRRTYARMVVESKMGRASLIFLRWQLKHTSMTMTQGYASNPIADRSLFEDYLNEATLFKGELLTIWTDETPLSGGAGRAMLELRATPHKDREALLRSAADQVHIRATGHGWCLAESQGCGGAGLYEATRCVNCKDGVIDPSFATTWQEIHHQQQELLELDDAGPAVKRRAERECRLARRVLDDLGVAPGTSNEH